MTLIGAAVTGALGGALSATSASYSAWRPLGAAAAPVSPNAVATSSGATTSTTVVSGAASSTTATRSLCARTTRQPLSASTWAASRTVQCELIGTGAQPARPIPIDAST